MEFSRVVSCFHCICFFKQKTAYEMRISDWSSDVCSSDLVAQGLGQRGLEILLGAGQQHPVLRPLRPGQRRHDGRQVERQAVGEIGIRRTLRAPHALRLGRSEESRVGKECVSACRSRRATSLQNKNKLLDSHNRTYKLKNYLILTLHSVNYQSINTK